MMLHGVFRTKEGKIIIAIMGLSVIILGGMVFAGCIRERKFVEKAAIAENYLQAGSYEQAISAYEQALAIKNGDQELLTVGLAEAYAGINEFDKALEVLRSYYQKTSGQQVKEKIEEIISEKTDYEYLQSISHAEIYIANKDYEKAIAEYEEAKQIKSKEVTAYQGIVDAYIALGEYDLAKEEVLEGQAITRDKSLEISQAVVDSYLHREEYNDLLEQAAEYIYQENYKDGITKFKEAIALMPKDSKAYTLLAQMYLSQKEYDKAVTILQDALNLAESKELKSLLLQAKEAKNLEEEKNSLLKKLNVAFIGRNLAEIKKLMKASFFQKELSKDIPVCYPVGDIDSIKGKAMIIYDLKTIYYGDIKEGKRNGKGIYLVLTEGNVEEGCYYYDGEWKANIPNGHGKVVEEDVLADDKGDTYTSLITTEGSYQNAKEDGRMTKTFVINDKITGKLAYTAKDGIAVPLSDKCLQAQPTPTGGSYVIGILSKKEENVTEYYSVEPQMIFGVEPFLNK